jgi:hypothetical protein
LVVQTTQSARKKVVQEEVVNEEAVAQGQENAVKLLQQERNEANEDVEEGRE